MATRKPASSGANSAKKAPPRLKNWASEASEASIFDEIRKTLITHKAKRISFDYGDDGKAVGVTFSIDVNGETMHFKLPVRLSSVEMLVKQSYQSVGRRLVGEALMDQAYRTAWANVRDWVAGQMAMIEINMVKMEEVFFPYLLVDSKRTAFDAFEDQRTLPSGQRFVVEERSS